MKYEQDQINSNAYILNYISDFKIRRLNQIAPNSSNGAHFIKINVYPSTQKNQIRYVSESIPIKFQFHISPTD